MIPDLTWSVKGLWFTCDGVRSSCATNTSPRIFLVPGLRHPEAPIEATITLLQRRAQA
jgi:hypothetical protein